MFPIMFLFSLKLSGSMCEQFHANMSSFIAWQVSNTPTLYSKDFKREREMICLATLGPPRTIKHKDYIPEITYYSKSLLNGHNFVTHYLDYQ